MPMVKVGAVGSKSRNFEVGTILRDNDHSEVRTHGIGASKDFLHDFRRGIRCDVEILRRQTAHHVPHRATREIGNVTTLAQTAGNLTRSLLHRRHLQANIVVASLCRGEREVSAKLASAAVMKRPRPASSSRPETNRKSVV